MGDNTQTKELLREFWTNNTDLSTRAVNAIVELGIHNPDELRNLHLSRLDTIRNCGMGTRNEIANYILYVLKAQSVDDVPEAVETALRRAWRGLCVRMVHDPRLILPARSVARALALLGDKDFTTNEESPE